MKKLILLAVLSFIMLSFLKAEPIDLKTAQKVAENFYRAHVPLFQNLEMNVTAHSHKGLKTYYLFTVTNGGFVIVSADDAVIPILGYSFEVQKQKDFYNPNVEFWMNQYNETILDIVSRKLSNLETRKVWDEYLAGKFSGFTKGVAPLFNITWGQDNGYNTYCPPGTPTGCVATAMGMIIRHYQYPTTGAGWHRYVHPTYGPQQAFFENTTYNYSQMPTNTGSTEAAKLLYHLGVAVDMNYSTSGSGAYSRDVPYVLANYFKYDQSVMYVEKANYEHLNWIALLKNELDNSRPIFYSGSGNSGGHAFLCLGYNDNNYFYFNWGWEGQSNGYYAIGQLNPGGMTFNNANAAVINIKPATPGTENFLWVKKFSNFPNQSAYPGYISAVDENVAWSIARDGSGNNASYKVYNVTVDGGASWTSRTLSFGDAFSMIFGLDANTAFIAAYGNGTNNKIIKTTNGGTDWTVVLSGAGAESFFNIVHFFDQNNGYVQGDPQGGYFEIYTTTNGGLTWTRVPSGNIPAPLTGEYGIVGHYTAVGDITWFTTNKGYIYKSTDKGYTWTKHQIGSFSNDTFIEIAFDENAQTGLALVSGSTPVRKFRTTNGGLNWTELTTAPDNFYSEGISAVPGTPNMFVSVGANYQTNRMGISYSLDGGLTWTDYADYYKAHQFVSVAMVSSQKGYVGSFQQNYQNGIWILGGTAALSADFTVSTTKACLNEEVTFTNNSAGNFTTIEWNFGEGAEPASANTIGPHVVAYSTPGQKTVTLTISNGSQSSTRTMTNAVEIVAPPVADFTFEINQSFPRLVNFDASNSTNVIAGAKYLWDFGNGVTQTRTVPTTSYIYPTVGLYTVTLEVQNLTNGCSSQVEKVVDNRPTAIENNTISVSIYPNPVKTILTVENADGSLLTIYSIEGKQVLSKQIQNQLEEVDLNKVSNGIYYVKIVKGEKTTTTTIVKQ